MKLFPNLIFIALFSPLTIFSSFGQYVYLEDRQFKDEYGIDFYPVVCNYIVNYFYVNDTSEFFISPQSEGFYYECGDLPTCDTQFYRNFLQIKHMGFNTIRLFGTQPVFYDTLGGTPGYRITAFHSITDPDDPIPRYDHFLSTPYESDSVTQKMFAEIDRILVQADSAGLKVILLTGGSRGRLYPALDSGYSVYLSSLSHHIASHSPQPARHALMAYDMFNEPSSSDMIAWPWVNDLTRMYHTKQAICNRVSRWYDALKTNDSSHLITMGAGGVDEILEYDLSVMKLDFASPHFYPRKMTYEPDSFKFTAMVNRVHGLLYWLGRNSQMPYIIGETGFSAEKDTLPTSGTHGDTSEQRRFAEITLQRTRDCLGSGYSWWKYQNSYWGSTYEDFFGLLDYGNCTPPCNTLEKPVVKAFENFNATGPLTGCYPPANYFDPFNHEIFAPGTNIIHGNVKDTHGVPIRDAVVFGTTFTKTNENNDSLYNYFFTFTNSLGNFVITPFDTAFPSKPNIIHDLYITAPGAERILRQRWNQWCPLVDNENYVLTQNRWDFDGQITDETFALNGETRQGWNSLTLTDVNVQTGVGVTFSARTEVVINQEFDAVSGSEVTIECQPTFPLCTDYDGYTKKSSFSMLGPVSNKQSGNIELSFLSDENDFKFTIFPNPGDGLFTVNVTAPGNMEDDLRVEIVNCLGINVINMSTNETTFNIDISSFAKGIYLIKISTGTVTEIQKLIVQ